MIVVVAAIFPHTTCGGDADADWASGNASPVTEIAVAAQSAPSFEILTDASPWSEWPFPDRET